MWLPLTLLVLAGTVSANYDHGWKVGKEYSYLVRSRTITGLDKLGDQYTGVILKALLNVQVKDSNTLVAKLTRGQYANIHKELPDGWDMPISDQMLDLQDLPTSGKPFEIKVKHGVVRDLIVEKGIPSYEVNLLKSVVSQLQVDTLGENAIKNRKNTQVPRDEEPYGMFSAMEDSVAGKCEVLYDITPLPDSMIRLKPYLVPMPQLKGDGYHIDIMKTKNFSRCDQRMGYHFGITGRTNWEPGSNDNGELLTKSSTSRIVISGSLKQFTLQSSVTTNQLFVSPRFYDQQNGIVISRMNLTLAHVKPISERLSSPTEPESTGNLVFVYDNPFTDFAERRQGKPTDSNQLDISDGIRSVSSSEEVLKNVLNLRGSSASASSSSISSSEEHQFWQPKPTLEDAPQNPLLPDFIGNKGKYIGNSGTIDTVQVCKEIIHEIANELEDANSIVKEQTLEKFTILTSLFRTMNKEKLTQLENIMHISLGHDLKAKDKTQAIKQNTWAVFRDAITQAGTGPALLIIKKWIENEYVVGLEAADIVSTIAKTARTPTAEYVRTMFNLATSSQVKNDKVLRVSAILAFTELVRMSQVNSRTIHNRYPVHTFGRMTSKHDTTVVNEYIPYLARELKQAIKDRDSPRIQTYILALGSIAHPKILSVFEPYLEGKESVTVYQRTLMVASLRKLSEINPKLARSVLYKIYLNTMEAHEVRCAAVFLLMITNPPVSMLQRMAEFTNYDTSKHVNSAVKSSLESLTTLTSPEWRDIANKARAALNLLNNNDYSYQYSRGIISETVDNDQNLINRLIFNYIGSDNSIFPKVVSFGSYNSYGDFKTPPTEAFAMLSSVKPILEMSFDSNEEEHSGKWLSEKLAEELNILPEEPIELESNLLMNTKFSSIFLPYDGRTLRRIPKWIKEQIQSMEDIGYVNINKLMSFEVTLSFPTETGFPFIYTFKVPSLFKLSTNGHLRLGEDMSFNAKIDTRLILSRKIQGRIGFLAPFEHQHFIAGVDMNFQAYAPVKLSVDIVPSKGSTTVKMWPLKGEEHARLLHYSVVPFTANHDVFSQRPLLTEKTTRRVINDQNSQKTISVPSADMEIFTLEMEGDKDDEEFWDWSMYVNKLVTFPWTDSTDQFKSLDLSMKLQREQKEPLIFTVSLNERNEKPENRHPWTLKAKAFSPSSTESNSEERQEQFLREVGKGIKSAMSTVMDIELQIPGELKTRNVFTVAWSESNADNKEKMLLFAKVNSQGMNVYEVCAAVHTVNPENTIPSYEMAKKILPKWETDMDIRFGVDCANGIQVNVKGQAVQSPERRKKIENLPLIKTCEEQMKQGNKILRDCQTAAALTMKWDEMNYSLNVESEPMMDRIKYIMNLLSNSPYVDTKVDISNPKNFGKNRIDIKTKLLDDLEKTDVTVHMSDRDVYFKDIGTNMLDLSTKDMYIENDNIRDLLDDNLESSCMLDKTRVETFDSNSYPLRLGKCWHVVLTTYPKLNSEKPGQLVRVSEDMSVSILAREVGNGRKEVKILLGEREIKLLPGDTEPEVIVDSQKIHVSREKNFQKRQEDEVVLEINRLSDNSIAVVANIQDVKLLYDGKRIVIKASDSYRGEVRGLCGNFDGEKINDFLGPQNCVMRKSEHFIASYALTNQECEGDSLENAKLAKEECRPIDKTWQSNVISDIDAGRENTEKWAYTHGNDQQTDKRCSIHKTYVEELNNKLCFSIRPVVACAPGCSPVDTKTKNYQFHCMEKNQIALNLKKRIEKGAMPDLSQKPVTMSQQINIPLVCKA